MARRLRMLLIFFLLFSVPAQGETWDGAREIRCREDRQGCRLLQMVMMGSFDGGDAEDAVLERVLASVYPRLAEVGEEDLAHFCAEFGEDEDVVRLRYYAALANCLRANIEAEALPEARLSAAQRVLLLFLEPDGGAEAEAQRAQIRAELTDDALRRIAGSAELPEVFVRWLIEEEKTGVTQ